MTQFTVHSFEQVLRFTSVPWEDLSSDRQNQLYFNVGALAAMLLLGKSQSYDIIENYKKGTLTCSDVNLHFKELAKVNGVKYDLNAVSKPF